VEFDLFTHTSPQEISLNFSIRLATVARRGNINKKVGKFDKVLLIR
jgi:hypothetical protein